jgi:dCTP diphosphatase
VGQYYQSLVGAPEQPGVAAPAVPPGLPWSPGSLQQIRARQREFAAARDWDQFHTPRNLLLALVGEVGELAEIFQWRGEKASVGLPEFSEAEKHHVGEELSDVLLYLIRLADVCGIDLSEAVLAKIARNAAKYPADKARGSSAKYTAYQE